MFKNKKPITAANIKPLKDLILAERPEMQPIDKKRQNLIAEIHKNLDLSATMFANIARPLIDKVTKYCQHLPDSSMYYAYPSGLIDLAINRTDAALSLAQNLLVLDKDEKPTEEQKLMMYALFSAAMLQGIGKLYTDYFVSVYDGNGQYVKNWQPLLESIVSVGKYYSYDLLRGDDLNLRNSITPLIARRIMPKEGFEKILANPEVFAIWLALLREDKEAAGPLAAILDRANAIAIQRYISGFLQKYEKLDSKANIFGTFIDTNIDNSIDRERILGAEFIVWLTDALKSGKIILNQPPLMVEFNGTEIVLHPEVLDTYMQEHKKLKNKVAIQKSFLAWNMHLLKDATLDAFNKTHDQLPPIKLDTAILPEKVMVYDNKTNKMTKINSLDLMINLHSYNNTNSAMLNASIGKLSAAGKWVLGDDNVSKARSHTNKI